MQKRRQTNKVGTHASEVLPSKFNEKIPISMKYVFGIYTYRFGYGTQEISKYSWNSRIEQGREYYTEKEKEKWHKWWMEKIGTKTIILYRDCEW